MDEELENLTQLVKVYSDFLESAIKRDAPPVVLDSLRENLRQASVNLQGARGAKGLNPDTGAAK